MTGRRVSTVIDLPDPPERPKREIPPPGPVHPTLLTPNSPREKEIMESFTKILYQYSPGTEPEVIEKVALKLWRATKI